MKGLHVNPEGDMTIREWTADAGVELLDWLQGIVGGFIESVRVGSWHLYVNEEGKLLGLDINIPATMLARELGWRSNDVLCGSVIFLGHTPDGEEADVPVTVLAVARLSFGASV